MSAGRIVGTSGGGIIMVGIDTSSTGVQEFGSATGWNNLAGSVLADIFAGGTGNVSPGGEGDIFLTNGGADTVNLAPGHSANHIELYGGTGSQSSQGAITVYTGAIGSITHPGLAQPGFWGNTAPGLTNDIFAAFTSSGTSATQVTVNGFNPASDVIDLSVQAWSVLITNKDEDRGLLWLNGGDPNHPASSVTGTPAVLTALLPGDTVQGAPAGADVILFGGLYPNAAALGASLHANHFGLFRVSSDSRNLDGDTTWHEIGIYNDPSNNAHIADIAVKTMPWIGPATFFSDFSRIEVAVSDMVVLLGVSANGLTGDNIHFVT